MRQPHRKQNESTAYHEAGHAVVAWLGGIAMKSVSIVPTTGAAGHIKHHDPLKAFKAGTARKE